VTDGAKSTPFPAGAKIPLNPLGVKLKVPSLAREQLQLRRARPRPPRLPQGRKKAKKSRKGNSRREEGGKRRIPAAV